MVGEANSPNFKRRPSHQARVHAAARVACALQDVLATGFIPSSTQTASSSIVKTHTGFPVARRFALGNGDLRRRSARESLRCSPITKASRRAPGEVSWKLEARGCVFERCGSRSRAVVVRFATDRAVSLRHRAERHANQELIGWRSTGYFTPPLEQSASTRQLGSPYASCTRVCLEAPACAGDTRRWSAAHVIRSDTTSTGNMI